MVFFVLRLVVVSRFYFSPSSGYENNFAWTILRQRTNLGLFFVLQDKCSVFFSLID